MTILPENYRISPLGKVAYGIAVAVAAADQLSKWVMLNLLQLPERQQILVAPPVFNLSMVWNHGVTFGMFRDSGEIGRWALVAVAATVVVVLIGVARTAERWLVAVGLGLILGGAIGNNLIDRVTIGAVADFLDFSGIRVLGLNFIQRGGRGHRCRDRLSGGGHSGSRPASHEKGLMHGDTSIAWRGRGLCAS